MRCRTYAGLGLFAIALVCSGCGTVMNLEDKPTTYLRRYPGTEANRVYGGVRIDAERGCDLFDLDPLVATYVWAVDLPLSAVADTITLPITIKSALDRKSDPVGVVEAHRCLSGCYAPNAPAKISDPSQCDAPTAGSALAELAGNKFIPWAMTPRLYMPLAASPPTESNP